MIVACLQFVFALSIIYQFAVIGVWQIKCLNIYTVVSQYNTLIAFAEYTLDVMFYELMKQSDVLGILKYTYAYGLWACECMCSAVRAVVQTICAF